MTGFNWFAVSPEIAVIWTAILGENDIIWIYPIFYGWQDVL